MQRNIIERWLVGLSGIDLRNMVESDDGISRALIHRFDVYRGQRLRELLGKIWRSVRRGMPAGASAVIICHSMLHS